MKTKAWLFVIIFVIFLLPYAQFQAKMQGQGIICEADFSTPSEHSWPEWEEISRPRHGYGPSIGYYPLGSIFINGSSDGYQDNVECLVFKQSNCNTFIPHLASLEFIFTNSSGGNVYLDNGSIFCTSSSNAMAYTSDELVLVTLNNYHSNFIGGFVGDLKFLGPGFVDERGPGLEYSVMGIMKFENNKIHILASRIIRKIYRFSSVRLELKIREETNETELKLHWVDFDQLIHSKINVDELMRILGINGENLMKAHDEIMTVDYPSFGISSVIGKAGLAYIVGTGRPCSNLPQRQILVSSFKVVE